ncbi:hypothetical protein EDB85DRAFT_2140171 [Lactarius pseudohatsudake]|nr:hypothetical protein EDB85DRAFT_2140171 [Lactarius pseudohatsudake]
MDLNKKVNMKGHEPIQIDSERYKGPYLDVGVCITFSVTEDRSGELVVVGPKPSDAAPAQDVAEANKGVVVAYQIMEKFRAFVEEFGDALPLG